MSNRKWHIEAREWCETVSSGLFEEESSEFPWIFRRKWMQTMLSGTYSADYMLVLLALLSQRLRSAIDRARRPSIVRRKLSHFQLLLWNCWTESNETWQEAKSERPPQIVWLSGRLENQDGRPVRFANKGGALYSGVQDMWPFGTLVFMLKAKKIVHRGGGSDTPPPICYCYWHWYCRCLGAGERHYGRG